MRETERVDAAVHVRDGEDADDLVPVRAQQLVDLHSERTLTDYRDLHLSVNIIIPLMVNQTNSYDFNHSLQMKTSLAIIRYLKFA